jgi:hypothetical protein
MAWDDIVFGVLTAGLYNVGKTAYKAGEAADQAGDALEEISDGAGSALAVLGSTINKLGKDISSFIKELEELLTIKRITPRDENDLWDEEVERLNALRQLEADLLAELEALGASDDDEAWSSGFWGAFFGAFDDLENYFKELAIRTKLAVVRQAIHEILYEEPGVVPTSLHNLQQILERFNTLEQPRLEDILDSVDDNLEQSEEILKEVKKLFVVKTWQAVPDVELSEIQRVELEALEVTLANYNQLITKNSTVSLQLQQALVHAQPETFQMAKMIGTSMEASGNPGNNPGDHLSNPGASSKGGGSASGNPAVPSHHMHRAVLPSGPSVALRGKVSAIAAQPMATSVATVLNQNAVSAYLDNYHRIEGRVRYYMRERFKVEKAIYRMKWVAVEEPGVIPKTLEEIRGILERLRTEAQPRVEVLLDNVSATVLETKEVLTNVNTSLESVQGTFDFLKQYSLYIKIGLAVAGGLTLLILLMGSIALFRVAFGI